MTCTQCDGHKIIRTVVPARAAGFLDGVCARCNGTGMEPDGIKSLPTLNIEQLRPHIGELNWILKDYGISIEATVDDNTGEVEMIDNMPNIRIGFPHRWAGSIV